MSENTFGEHVIAFTFTVGVDKRKGRPLGMYMNDNKFYGALYVDHVSSDKSTLIGEWNAENPTATIRAGDQVVAVNDKKGCASFLYQQTKALDLLELTVLRNVEQPQSYRVHPAANKRVAEAYHSIVLMLCFHCSCIVILHDSRP